MRAWHVGDVVWNLMTARGWFQRSELEEASGVSSGTVAKLLNTGDVSEKILRQVAASLDANYEEIVKTAKELNLPRITVMAPTEAFSDDAKFIAKRYDELSAGRQHLALQILTLLKFEDSGAQARESGSMHDKSNGGRG